MNIGGKDIHDGNLRLMMGLIWTIILRYEINKGQEKEKKKKKIAHTHTQDSRTT